MSPSQIVTLSAPILGFSIRKLRNKSRSRDLVDARRMIASLILEIEAYPLKQIAAALGRKDHTTIIHYRDTHQAYMKTDIEYRAEYNAFKKIIENEMDKRRTAAC